MLLFFGFIFLMLDYSIIIKETIVNVIPSFIGYIFVLLFLRKFRRIIKNISQIRVAVSILTILSTLQYAFSLSNMAVEHGDVSRIFSIVFVVCYLCIGLSIFSSLAEYEKEQQLDFHYNKLISTLIAASICDIGMYASYWLSALVVPGIILSVSIKLFFIARLFLSQLAFSRYKRQNRISF